MASPYTSLIWECKGRPRLQEWHGPFDWRPGMSEHSSKGAGAAQALKLETQAAGLAGDTASIAGSSQAAIEQLQAELADSQRAASATEQERSAALHQLQATLQVPEPLRA